MRRVSSSEYTQPSLLLSGATIGQHVRHILELFQCLENGYEEGLVNYENRKRDHQIETDKELALSLFSSIQNAMERPDKSLILESGYGLSSSESIRVSSNYYREIIYNLEHTIHHMALIRIGVNEISSISLPDTFGVAPSTTQYRKECAQ